MLSNFQNQLVTVQAPNDTKGTSGGIIPGFTTTIGAMPCRIVDAGANWKLLYAQRHIEITHQVFTNQLPTIAPGYQLLYGSRVFRVVGLAVQGSMTRIDVGEIT